MKFNKPFDRVRSPLAFEGERSVTRCQAHFLGVCDINAIIRRALTGDSSVLRDVHYGDARTLPESLHDAENKMALARSYWHDMPEAVRATVGSPERLLAIIDSSSGSITSNSSQLDGDSSLKDGSSSDTQSLDGQSDKT